ncbi:hypothetical protein EJ04DRAFT_518695 [Polyplosphaeria fusca]|uniref:Uncharacterized protein n=1 Tax=Polyplosphaeria fusca TaxID=682080 RepID=A0A9P4RBL3_9PLEO|nr:hypothetical protein EJ04DRAFT_518695 [Polyplosphaeria fusca]
MSDTESLPLPLPAQSPYEVTHFPEHYNKYPQDLRSALLRTDNICASNKHSDADSSYVLIHEKVRESQGKSSWHKTMEVCSYLHDADWKLAMCFMKEYGAVVEPLMMVRKDSLGGSERQGELSDVYCQEPGSEWDDDVDERIHVKESRKASSATSHSSFGVYYPRLVICHGTVSQR